MYILCVFTLVNLVVVNSHIKLGVKVVCPGNGGTFAINVMLNSLLNLTLSHRRTGQLSWSVRGHWTRAVPGWEGEADLHCGVQCRLCVPVVVGAVHTVTCWVKCGWDTWIPVSASGGNTPNNAARGRIIRATEISAVKPSCLLFLLRCFLRDGSVSVIVHAHLCFQSHLCLENTLLHSLIRAPKLSKFYSKNLIWYPKIKS